ncbi:Ger(x)C family spore germination protein [Cytobacillus oceanisediminis]|uniref:Ger(x)C family spore germination protein n=1 Tax=Cytobacillus oceanisediminis TaxID=665099 RepID=UPI001C238EDB|nr:Ger(x)C family spore germination protein [Cytobacillus oceanisediminis]MBU8768320.1 Ger(x)C family spore germination protein [Cytobacillus oceanisediminis]
MKLRFFILVCTLICTSCVPPSKIIEMQGISTILGFDLLDDETYKGTISLLQFDRLQGKTSTTISAEGSTSKEIRQRLEQQTSHDISSGQLRTILFDKKMAEEGIFSFLDTMLRDTSINPLIFLAITDKSEETINSKEYEEFPEMGSYMYQLLDKHEKKEMLINSNLHDFVSALYESGIDPTLPIIKNIKGEAPFIEAVALFRDDKMVGSISLIKTFYIKLFTNKNAFLGDLTLTIPSDKLEKTGVLISENAENEKYKITLHPINYRGKIEVVNNEIVNLNASISVSILETQPSTSIIDKESTRKLERLIGEELNNEFEKILEELKILETDPIGIGRKIKSLRKYSHLSNGELSEKYSAVKIKPNITVEIKRPGAVN